MIQSYSDPSEAFPRLPDLTAVKARWRIRCNRWIRSLQPVSSVLLLVATLRPDPTSAAFPPGLRRKDGTVIKFQQVELGYFLSQKVTELPFQKELLNLCKPLVSRLPE